MPEGLKGAMEEGGTVTVVQRRPNVGRGQIWENVSCIALMLPRTILPRTLRLQHSASVGEIARGLFSGVRVYSLADKCMLFHSEQYQASLPQMLMLQLKHEQLASQMANY